METELLAGMAAAPVVAALLQVVKPYLRDPRSWPIAAIVLAVGWNVAVNASTAALAWHAAALLGVMSGLAASGLYEIGRAVRDGNDSQ